MARSYEKPPIAEAVCELRLVSETPWSLIPGLLRAKVEGEFPGVEQATTVNVATDPTGSQIVQSPNVTVRFSTPDQSELLQLAPNRFSIHQMRPYRGWDHFRERIRWVLDRYHEVATVQKIDRIGLRYVDRVALPGEGSHDLDEYFRVMPRVPEPIPQVFAAFWANVEVPYEDPVQWLRVTFGTAVPERSNEYVCVLDMDLYSSGDAAPDLAGVMDWLESAHARLESAFDAAFTDKAHRELFGEVG